MSLVYDIYVLWYQNLGTTKWDVCFYSTPRVNPSCEWILQGKKLRYDWDVALPGAQARKGVEMQALTTQVGRTQAIELIS